LCFKVPFNLIRDKGNQAPEWFPAPRRKRRVRYSAPRRLAHPSRFRRNPGPNSEQPVAALFLLDRLIGRHRRHATNERGAGGEGCGQSRRCQNRPESVPHVIAFPFARCRWPNRPGTASRLKTRTREQTIPGVGSTLGPTGSVRFRSVHRQSHRNRGRTAPKPWHYAKRKEEMVRLEGEQLNSLIHALEEWERYLAQLDSKSLRCVDVHLSP
jgi:hypothetical protein